MSGFDKNWLALREPADRDARDPALIKRLASEFSRQDAAENQTLTMLDIGCGTGSTYRSLSPFLPKATRWHLLDHDAALLAEAERRIGRDQGVDLHQFDLNDLDALPLDSVDIVTASALFDLCSAAFSNRFVAKLAATRTGLYAALNYDGHMSWSQGHTLDEAITSAFNRHQRLDKGFGLALGPDATSHLQAALEAADYAVLVADSPWRLGNDQAALQHELLLGIANAVREIGDLTTAQIDGWLSYRLADAALSGSSCRIGHQDLLALPRR